MIGTNECKEGSNILLLNKNKEKNMNINPMDGNILLNNKFEFLILTPLSTSNFANNEPSNNSNPLDGKR